VLNLARFCSSVRAGIQVRTIFALVVTRARRRALHHGRHPTQRLRDRVYGLGRVQMHRLARDGFGDAGWSLCLGSVSCSARASACAACFLSHFFP